MSDPAGHLERWRTAGLVDAQTAERIAAWEREQRSPARGERRGDLPGALEAFLYLGFVVAAVGVIVLVNQQWDQLESWARVLVLAVPSALAVAAGPLLRTFPDPGIRRAGDIAWMMAVGLLLGLGGVTAEEYGSGLDDANTAIVVTALVFAGAVLLWALSPSHPEILGVGVAGMAFAIASGTSFDDHQQQAVGAFVMVFAAGFLALTESGFVRPRVSARALFGLGLVLGAFIARFEVVWPWELPIFVAGAALVALSVLRASFTFMVQGVLGIFAGLVAFTFEHFESELGPAFVLIISGVMLIVAALVLTQARSALRARKATI